MEPIELKYPIQTLDGECLLPAGAILNDESLAALVARGRRPRTMRLLAFGTVRRDLGEFLSCPPYSRIFDNPEQLAELLSALEQVEIIEPVLASLEYFRESDFHTYRHILMVFFLSSFLTRLILRERARGAQETIVGPAHDFGKICIPLEILAKRTPLTSQERKMLTHHTLAGYVLLAYYLGDAEHLASRVARDHHEKRDGSGYPRGINSLDRMVEIVSVSDIYDALISPRPYRPVSYDNRTALEHLTWMAQRNEISWEPVRGLVAQNRSDKPDYLTFEISLEKRGIEPAGNLYGVTVEDNSGKAS